MDQQWEISQELQSDATSPPHPPYLPPHFVPLTLYMMLQKTLPFTPDTPHHLRLSSIAQLHGR